MGREVDGEGTEYEEILIVGHHYLSYLRDILKKFIPVEYNLKCKSSIDALIISSHCMKMMSMLCEVSVYFII